MKAISVLLVAVLGVSCSSSPTAPTPPVATPAPQPTPAPVAAADLVVSGTLDFVSCVSGLCSYMGLVRNAGTACASNISGETWVVSAQGQEVARARWAMDPSRVIPPGHEVYYEGDGMPQIALNHLDGRYFARFSFDSRPC